MGVFTRSVTDELIERRGLLATKDVHQLESCTASTREISPSAIIDGIPVHHINLPHGWRQKPTFFRRLVNYCENQQDEIEVVQFLNLDKWAFPAILKLRRLGIRTVFTQTLTGYISMNPLKKIWQRFDRGLSFNLLDYIVVSSREMARQLTDFGVPSAIRVIPNGVDLDYFRPIDNVVEMATLRQNLGLRPNWTIILAVGPISPRKGIDRLLEAFARIYHDQDDLHLVLVGPRHDLSQSELRGFQYRLEKIIRSSGARDHVHFIGASSNVREYLQAADILVFPSWREGMPNVVPEAMASGVPVIMTPFLGLPEEFGVAGKHYVLSDWEPEVLATDIRKLLVDTGHRKNIGENGRRWVEQKLDLNDSLDQYATLYRELANRSRKVRATS